MREIGRLRLKFIIYNMLVVTAVIGITFCAVTSVVKHRVNDQAWPCPGWWPGRNSP